MNLYSARRMPLKTVWSQQVLVLAVRQTAVRQQERSLVDAVKILVLGQPVLEAGERSQGDEQVGQIEQAVSSSGRALIIPFQ